MQDTATPVSTPARRRSFSTPSQDGTLLHLVRWESDHAHSHLLIVHGYNEYGERYSDLAEALVAQGIDCTAVDLRGHGRSEGIRGHVMAFDEYLDDIDAALDTLPSDVPRYILGHSNGGLAVLDHGRQRKPNVAGTIVTNPFIDLALKAPALKLWVGRRASKYFPKLSLKNELNPENLTRCPVKVEAWRRDTNLFHTVNTRWFTEASERQVPVRSMTEFHGPLLFITSDSDPVACPKAGETLGKKIASDYRCRKNELHEMLNELDREALYGEIGTWIQQIR